MGKTKIFAIATTLGLIFSNLPYASAITDYKTLSSTDFENNDPWAFTTANATLSINKDNVGGNTTSKLQYSIVDQKGGRVATKNLDSAAKGQNILVKFDWYPGKINDKGSTPDENGGEFRLLDSAGNIVFTLNNTNKSPLTYFARGQAPTKTSIANPEAWYHFEVNFDISTNQVSLKIADQNGTAIEEHTSPIDSSLFDGSVASMRLVGIRTAGNNETWNTYLDNVEVSNVPVSSNTLYLVEKLPYQRVYVNKTTNDISSIGLPKTVNVTLADNSKREVAVTKWEPVGNAWDPSKAGVYEFNGTLAETDGIVNSFNKTAKIYVYNRLTPPENERQTEFLDRGVIALKSDDGIFVSWRLLADDYDKDVKFNVYRNGEKLNTDALDVTTYLDAAGSPEDTYTVETLVNGKSTEKNEVKAASKDYLSIPMQKPEGGTLSNGQAYTYSVNDSGVGDLDGDGELEVIVKWYPSNAIDSSFATPTGPTIFDAYKLDGTLLWRMNMGYNLTSGAHYNQFVVADFDGDGKSEFLIKTADGTKTYGATDGKFDSSKVVSAIGNPEDDGKYVNSGGHVFGGPEYMSVFNGETGKVIDTIDYAFPVGEEDGGASWGDTWFNRSDRFLSGLAYLDGKKPSAIIGRGYYERTTFAAYSLVDGKLKEEWTFDSDKEGRGGGLGFHNLATGDVDNDGYDEIIAGSLTLDQDGSILYAMDGNMGREQGSHGDASHVGAFDPDREGLSVFEVHEIPAVASEELHDGATGETLMSYYASVDAGRGVAANITSSPGYEFWGAAGSTVATGGGIYNVKGGVEADKKPSGLSTNFALYWDGDLLQELLDDTSITKYNENTGKVDPLKSFAGVHSNNGTKATPTLQADILGDWREEVLLPTTDDTELRVFSTTIPTNYRLYTLMQDPLYKNGIGMQNSAYNQPPHIGFYLGEDIKDTVSAGKMKAPGVDYTPSLQALKHTVDLELNTPVLKNKLDQAQHQLDIGRSDQAAKFMEDFIKQLGNVDDALKTKLTADAQDLIVEWNK
ncbi:S-layer protein [Bacillus sp. AFS076308]|uniref:rhamnogalacturonan lyase family protein n=1 Tax=Bacillus sp. AFS076308 TaxID=2033512 RepID=UPI000BF50398|nr:Ig-like domain-containing protein [Bacillus sp. AFS076308]PFO08016.1 S-layer protein [Bacillus sp. AFS076308]